MYVLTKDEGNARRLSRNYRPQFYFRMTMTWTIALPPVRRMVMPGDNTGG